MAAHRRPSLGGRLFRHVLLPLAATWLVGTVVAIAVAALFAQRAFDRSLLDDAHLLASHVRVEGGRLRLMLSQREIDTVLFDREDTMFFQLRAASGETFAGDPNLAAPSVEPGAPHRFDDLQRAGRTVRVVTLRLDQPVPFDVALAETTLERRTLQRQLLLYSLAPQLLLLAALAWWLRRAIRGDVQPLAELERAVGGRDANDLTPVSVTASTRDIEALATAINSLLLRLSASVQAQREFTGNVAHELRTPLAGIRALADYGLAQPDPAAWREQLRAVIASEARASRLLDRLLALALVQEARTGLRLAPLALNDLVRAFVLRRLAQADASGVDLGARGVDTPAWALGDATLIEGILDNLLDNALRYGEPPAGEAPVVTVAVERQPDGAVRLSVQDNGPGLPGELQAQLMARGAQGEMGQLLGQGSGLGLALVAQYAQLMKARVTLGAGPQGRGWMCVVEFAGAPSAP
ncbi:MAG TPA: sensor histidine kinase N-terminal domain-containing protein [Ramlibacter sp.]|nr:sensor histidine kinase N-terminal domain-containing protein [Ramlibacter sp.]